MPTYAYACADCGHAFDIVQSFSDDSLTVCPQCEGRLRKQFNAVGVVFKGSGFYRTDSRSGSKSSTLPAKTEGSASTGSSDSATSSPTSTSPTKQSSSTAASTNSSVSTAS
ncbi:MAG: FmdB family transcriptional regulator [Actinobacteria bacterium]|uniref:FmdB family zinc ribbon protein n=1 Tax=Nostocoides veronense TaxID=330836 RepID=UPI0031D6C752|nr:FmdB family transcriptional regulator [Actinomycetota bacterium]